MKNSCSTIYFFFSNCQKLKWFCRYWGGECNHQDPPVFLLYLTVGQRSHSLNISKCFLYKYVVNMRLSCCGVVPFCLLRLFPDGSLMSAVILVCCNAYLQLLTLPFSITSDLWNSGQFWAAIGYIFFSCLKPDGNLIDFFWKHTLYLLLPVFISISVNV